MNEMTLSGFSQVGNTVSIAPARIRFIKARQ